ncbi:MAG: pyridoxamine 5'-phosphate oxidase family protein [Antricoccus sp.]
MPEEASAEQLETIQKIMKGERTCMITTINAEGALHSHPMTTQEAQFDGNCWFIMSQKSGTSANVEANPQVNVAYAGGSSWLSLAGTAQIVRDQAKKKELWNTFTESWFTDGAEDPDVVLLHVETTSAQYWDSPGKAVTMVSMLKAKITGDTPSAGESDTVQL